MINARVQFIEYATAKPSVTSLRCGISGALVGTFLLASSVEAEPAREFHRAGQLAACCDFTPDSERIVVGTTDTHVWVCEISDSSICDSFSVEYKLRDPRWYGVTALSVTSDGREVITGDKKSQVIAWDLVTHERGRIYGKISTGGDSSVCAIACLPDGAVVAAGRHENAYLWRADESEPPLLLRGDGLRCEAIGVLIDGSLIATASGAAHHQGEVAIWSSATGRLLHRFERTATYPTSVCISQDGKHVVAGTAQDQGSSRIYLWNAETYKLMRQVPLDGRIAEGSVRAVAYSSEFNIILAATVVPPHQNMGKADRSSAYLRIIDAMSGELLGDMDLESESVIQVRMSPNQQWIAVVDSSGRVRLWQTERLAKSAAKDQTQ